MGREHGRRDRLPHRPGHGGGREDDRGRKPSGGNRGRRRQRLGDGAGARYLRQTAARSR